MDFEDYLDLGAEIISIQMVDNLIYCGLINNKITILSSENLDVVKVIETRSVVNKFVIFSGKTADYMLLC